MTTSDFGRKPDITVLNVRGQPVLLRYAWVVCLQAAAWGIPSNEIQSETGFSYGTSKSYIAKATVALGATDRTHAVTMLLDQGVLKHTPHR